MRLRLRLHLYTIAPKTNDPEKKTRRCKLGPSQKFVGQLCFVKLASNVKTPDS